MKRREREKRSHTFSLYSRVNGKEGALTPLNPDKGGPQMRKGEELRKKRVFT